MTSDPGHIQITKGARFPVLSGKVFRTEDQEFGIEEEDFESIRLRVRERGADAGDYKIDAPVSSFSLSQDGKELSFTYEWQAGDTDSPGRYWAQLEITLTDGRIGHAPTGRWIPVFVKETI